MQVSSIYFYPVKSLAGLSLSEAMVDDFGVCGDRRWMIVDEAGKFVTQRQFPRLCLIKVEWLSEQALNLTFPDGEHFNTCPDYTVDLSVLVWSDTCRAKSSSNNRLDVKLSEYVGKKVRLVYMPDSEFRQVDVAYFREEQRVSFADGFPLLLLTEESMLDLNGRLQDKIGVERFRPNIVVRGASKAYEEDTWRRIKIGEVEFAVVKPCSRCVMTTVNPLTGVKGREPLQALGQYRKQEGGIMFGQNLVQLNAGKLGVGEQVVVLD